ncbi:MAG TPA: tetratricopeptide repeat protein [Vicinamibacterales bacterium]|jgi:tetratricopeptide (TPR) repeat protein|nr:tetratricopeptide repeat protein [Vicinamibacterales bacterium]
MQKKGLNGVTGRRHIAAQIVVVLVAVATFTGCAQLGRLKAMRSFKEANTAYAAQDYKKAVGLYEEALKADPNLNFAYFFLGNSYDNLFVSSKKGEPENDKMLDKAVENYKLSAERLAGSTDEQEKLLGRRSMEYLVAAYGADKLNAPDQAEPVVQKMIQMDPTVPENYFALAKIYEDAGAYAEAEEMYLKAKEVAPSNPTVYTTLAGYYNRQGQFDKTISALEERAAKEPTNPEAFHTIASYYWDETRGDPKLKDAEKLDFVKKGLAASDKAIQLKPDYVDAIVFKGLLLRQQALLEKDPAKQTALVNEAKALSEKANDIRKKQTTAGD